MFLKISILPRHFVVPISLFIAVFTFIACDSSKKQGQDEEWQTLFNGKNLDGWTPKLHHHELGDNYANTFRVENGVIAVNYDGYDQFNARYGHLFYKQTFSSYHLKFICISVTNTKLFLKQQ